MDSFSKFEFSDIHTIETLSNISFYDLHEENNLFHQETLFLFETLNAEKWAYYIPTIPILILPLVFIKFE